MLGTVAGIAAFVAIVGLSQTASGQIGKQFNRLESTQVTVSETGKARSSAQALAFPPGADAMVDRIHGVVAAGVFWPVLFSGAAVSAMPPGSQRDDLSLPVFAATPGALAASGATLREGVLYNGFHESHAQNVAVIGAVAAAQLRLSNLANRPAIFIGGQPFTVIGILASDARLPGMEVGVSVPATTAGHLWGAPRSGQPSPLMLVHTRLGAAQVVAKQVPIALRPDDPQALAAFAPPSPAQLRHTVTASLSTVFLALAGVALVVGAIGITNTTLVAVLERTGEIGLRRAVGARPVHIASQFLAESTALGLFGGLIGASLGVLTTLGVTIYHHWTALLDPRIVLAAPVAGAVIGLLAGLYPALRATAVEPADALRR
jgi:putative ABC transport system permease protein